MASIDPWDVIHGERRALLDDLEQLSDEQWAASSLCEGWSVQLVVGHIIATAKMTPPKFVVSMTGAGFSFNKMVAKAGAVQAAGSPKETLERLRGQLTATTHPPGPIMAMVGEAIVHSEDIRRPLGIKRKYPMDAMTEVATFYKGSNLIVGGKKRVAGLRLKASDSDWSTGEGSLVSGPMISLVMAIAGRSAVLGDLSGYGLPTLTSRTQPEPTS